MSIHAGRPRGVFSVDDVETLRNSLALYNIKYLDWGMRTVDGEELFPGSKPFTKLIDEVVTSKEVFLSYEQVDGEWIFIRHLFTVSVRITHESTYISPGRGPNLAGRGTPLKRKFFLQEFREMENGALKPRKHADSSLSEKLRYEHESSDLKEAIRRGLREELGIEVSDEHLSDEYVFLREGIPTEPSELIVGGVPIHASSAYPGLWTHNELTHYIWRMPSEYFNPEGYREVGTNHVFKWISLEDSVNW